MDGPAELDNVVWHALIGPHADLAERDDGARRYPVDVAAFSALPDAPGAGDWDALRRLVGAGNVAVLFRGAATVPDGWETVWREDCHQMVAPTAWSDPDGVVAGVAIEELGTADVDAMLELVARTEPGPFARRTNELGTYLGIRDRDGRLIALAGERLRSGGATELSAICTDPAHRRRGLAAMLARTLAERIRERGEVPFLHVMESNTAAHAAYLRMGFTERRVVEVVVVAAPS